MHRTMTYFESLVQILATHILWILGFIKAAIFNQSCSTQDFCRGSKKWSTFDALHWLYCNECSHFVIIFALVYVQLHCSKSHLGQQSVLYMDTVQSTNTKILDFVAKTCLVLVQMAYCVGTKKCIAAVPLSATWGHISVFFTTMFWLK